MTKPVPTRILYGGKFEYGWKWWSGSGHITNFGDPSSFRETVILVTSPPYPAFTRRNSMKRHWWWFFVDAWLDHSELGVLGVHISYLRSAVQVWWEPRLSGNKMRRRVLIAHGRSSTEVVTPLPLNSGNGSCISLATIDALDV